MTVDRRTRAIARKVEHCRRSRQLLFPISELFGEYVTLQQFTLPEHKVGILNRQLRKRWLLPFRERSIQRRDFAHDHTERPAVGNEVMHTQQQHMFLCRKSQDRKSTR